MSFLIKGNEDFKQKYKQMKLTFKELNKYEQTGSFILKTTDKLREVCNSPTNKSGIYIVFAINDNVEELIYIGRSGKHNKDKTMFIRKAGLGGTKDRIVNGHQFGKIPRRISWINQMKKESISKLKVYWFVTHNDKYSDCPREVENNLLSKYLNLFGVLPKWNKEL